MTEQHDVQHCSRDSHPMANRLVREGDPAAAPLQCGFETGRARRAGDADLNQERWPRAEKKCPPGKRTPACAPHHTLLLD